ncbi:MAG: ferrochelatase [Deltaproteobacteria bacterium]|nr:MAG: ferrochelatase [Deltaproteobacteria bacterium]
MIGVLLINIGTPDSTKVRDVRRYLAEFLSDGRVLDLHPVARWLLLHGVILRTRPARSAAAYQRIWTPEGSPLLVHGQALARALGATLGQGFQVAAAMRYGNPGIAPVLRDMVARGCDRVIALPLFPQYAAATHMSAVDAITAAVRDLPAAPELTILREFWNEDAFLSAMVARTRESLADFDADHVLFSFHGLPERQVRRAELPGPDGTIAGHCLSQAECCATLHRSNRRCYRAQCFATARQLAARLALPDDSWSVAFQSRLGRLPWIRPYTDEVLQALGARGVRRLAVVTPSFVADCLETLEELGIAGRETFLAAGGTDWHLVPCLNDHPAWVEGLAALIRTRR